MRPAYLSASPLLAALVWTIALLIEPGPFLPASTLLIGLGLILTATVATVGMTVVSGRWAHRLGLVSLGLTAVLAVMRPIDLTWMLATTLTAASLLALLSPAVTANIRKLPSAAGPPPRAVLPPLLLLTAPALLGLSGNDAMAWALLVVGLTAPVAAFLYSRVIPGGLLVIRLGWPLLAVVMSPLLGWVAGTAAVTLGLTVSVIAWGPSVKTSYHPPREVGTTFPIPPELAPKEILDAARIDQRGRRK